MKKLQSKKAQPLSGEGNKRLKKHRPTNNAETAAWADIDLSLIHI